MALPLALTASDIVLTNKEAPKALEISVLSLICNFFSNPSF